MADSTKKSSATIGTASKSDFDLASVIFDKDKGRKCSKGTDRPKYHTSAENSEKVACTPSEKAMKNRPSLPSTSKNKDDVIISTISESFSKDRNDTSSQTFAEFKAEMHELHKNSFEEIQLIIANSFENLRQSKKSRIEERPTCGRKLSYFVSDENNVYDEHDEKSDGELSDNTDSDIPLTQKRYKIPRLAKKTTGEDDIDIVQQIDDLLNDDGDGDKALLDNNHDDENFDECEKFLEEKYSVVDKVGNKLPDKVAVIINHMFDSKLADDRSKDILEKYLRPGNVEIYPQKINPEIWGHLKQATQFKDIDSFKLSEKLIKCSYAVMSLVELLLKSKKKDKKPDENDKSLSSGIKIGMDALSLLGHIVQDHNQIRRDSLKVDLNFQFKKLCNPSHNSENGSSKWLFGDELGKRVKDIKETNQVGSSVSSGSRQFKSNPRNNFRSKPFLFQGNGRNNYKRPQQNQYRFANKKSNSYQRSNFNQNKKNQTEKK